MWASVGVGVHLFQLLIKCSCTQVAGGDVDVGVWSWVVDGMRVVVLSIYALYIHSYSNRMAV